MTFDFDPEKNEKLYRERGVSFPQIIEASADHGVLAHFPHPNAAQYPNQHILVVALEGYAYCVPYVADGERWFLKTIYPSRKFKSFLEGEDHGPV